MSKIVNQKKKYVDEIAKKMSDSMSFCIFNYDSLNSEKITNLRKTMRSLNSKILVVKNNIINRSLKKANINVKNEFCGQNAILFSDLDSLIPAENIHKLSQSEEVIKLKMIYFEKTVINDDMVENVAGLKNKDHVITVFAQTIMQPIYKLLFIIKNVPK